jgi:hypothetical protein
VRWAVADNKTDKKQMSSNNLIIVMVLVSLLVLGIAVVASKVLIGGIVLDSRVLKVKMATDNTLKQDVTAAPELINSFNALGNEATELNDALPAGVDYPSLIVELENMANTAGVTLTSVDNSEPSLTASPGAGGATSTASDTSGSAAVGSTTGSASGVSGSGTGSGPQQFQFSISTTSTYDQIQKLLTEIESSVRPMEVTGTTLNGAGSALQGTIDVTTWYEPPATLPFGTETVK